MKNVVFKNFLLLAFVLISLSLFAAQAPTTQGLSTVTSELTSASSQIKQWIMIIIGLFLAVGILYTIGMMVTGNPKGKENIGWWLGALVFYAVAWALI